MPAAGLEGLMQLSGGPALGVRLVAAGLLVAALSALGSASAQQDSVQPTSPPAPPPQLLLPYAGATLEKYFARLRIDFAQLDADRDGRITQRDVDRHVLMETALTRAYGLVVVMQYDLDGDGSVTEDEIRQAMGYNLRRSVGDPAKKIDDVVRSTMALDTDRDGKVNFAEAGKSVHPLLQQSFGVLESERTRLALTIEAGVKGEITWQDFEAAGDSLFRKVDADHDGKITPQEHDDYRRTSAASQPPAAQPR
jgi:Ca2+-binding EF-hand superfamily protein